MTSLWTQEKLTDVDVALVSGLDGKFRHFEALADTFESDVSWLEVQFATNPKTLVLAANSNTVTVNFDVDEETKRQCGCTD